MADPNNSAKWSKYSIEEGKLVRKAEFCPQCGPGIFMASHANRSSCGRCGHTINKD
ncbi:MAG TPA: 30S ribosomal protein S27ae [Candidatus Poseidoniales archaeon]|jgi:small subunit ribosomal protein S27Ae|nr:MAG: 30S ribosomal protein S27ae [Euryarchaeota archaeon]HIG02807.1 30S ribosomal protein S27ae [Candidatus Poseidoniales archaeon]HIK77791.1 30S ribosomal protein S27ae [Candidatus Poseidoniales archaeon]